MRVLVCLHLQVGDGAGLVVIENITPSVTGIDLIHIDLCLVVEAHEITIPLVGHGCSQVAKLAMGISPSIDGSGADDDVVVIVLYLALCLMPSETVSLGVLHQHDIVGVEFFVVQVLRLAGVSPRPTSLIAHTIPYFRVTAAVCIVVVVDMILIGAGRQLVHVVTTSFLFVVEAVLLCTVCTCGR